MATGYSSLYSSPTIPLNYAPVKGSTNSRLVMCGNTSHFSVKTQTRSSVKNWIFEDQSVGVVCYKDENGEIICEGFDEGPRFQPQLSRFHNNNSSDSKSIEIIDLFQRCWVQSVDEDHELNNVEDEGIPVQTDRVKFNGYNKLG